MKRTAFCLVFLFGVGSASNAWAGFFQQVYRGLELAATPSGFPLLSNPDGSRSNGERNGRFRIMPDRVGRGYTVEFDRAFGRDARGRPEVLDLGLFEVELRGPTQATLGYTNRLMLIGNAQVNANNLSYSLRFKSGFQDAELRGQVSASTNLEVNQFGFYTLNVDISNTDSELRIDGLVVNDQRVTNFDIGPINIKGNIFLDGLVTALAATGADTTLLEGLTPGSPVDRLADELRQRVLSTPLVAGLQVSADRQLPPIPPRLLIDVPGVEPQAQRSAPADTPKLGAVPEPGTLMLVSLGGLVLWGWRRR